MVVVVKLWESLILKEHDKIIRLSNICVWTFFSWKDQSGWVATIKIYCYLRVADKQTEIFYSSSNTAWINIHIWHRLLDTLIKELVQLDKGLQNDQLRSWLKQPVSKLPYWHGTLLYC